MKKLMFALVAVMCAATLLAQDAQQKRRSTGAEKRARREAKIAAEGGRLMRPIKGNVVRILTKTDKATVADLDKVAKEITQLLGLVVEVVDTENASKEKTACLITIADLGNAPTLLVAPEDPWASVNVKKLMADSPSDEVLKARIVKETWRAFGYAMGAANSDMQPCVMRPIFAPQDLDSHKVAILSPSPLNSIITTAQRLNIAKMGFCTYKTACEEGWAPAPTNDVQKAIAAAVKAEAVKDPSNPIRIKYDPKTGK